MRDRVLKVVGTVIHDQLVGTSICRVRTYRYLRLESVEHPPPRQGRILSAY